MSLPSEYLTELNLLNKKIAQDQPSDVLEYCARYFSNRLAQERQGGYRAGSISAPFGFHFGNAKQSEEVLDPKAVDEPALTLFKNLFGADPISPGVAQDARPDHVPSSFVPLRRSSVSAEALNPKLFDANWQPPYHDLTPAQIERLNRLIVKNFLFSSLEEDALSTVLHALQEQSYKKDDVVIRQGDEGEYFYLIEKGEVDYIVNGKKVSSGGPGASFGELALMYNSPRAATVQARSDLILWALDRSTFRRILLEVTARKREMYEAFLKDVAILGGLLLYQRSKLADALHTEVYRPGEVIIKEGDVGENFYLVESGEAEVVKEKEGVVAKIKKGDYFGEIALLNDLPRQATVKAITGVKVATLGKSGFQRLLGPVVDVLKAQDPRK